MNRNAYRLVFSRLRGMLVAISETATAHAHGNASRGEALRSVALQSFTLFAMRHVAFAALAVFGLAPALADAQIVPSGANAPNVINTANGIPQVDVNRPSGAGVSMNTYSQFDVSQKGAILNNSPVITGTQLAGQINGNPNFGANDAAKLIVNQVNSNNPSQLRGFVEVAGQKATVVIANPSGILVDGGGFINTTRGILTTGNPVFDGSGNLAGFDVTQGNITVQGAGLNASNIDQVDLLARAVQANAAIYANTLNVMTGSNRVDYASLNPTAIAGTGAVPGVSIDVSQLGGMYANRITLIGTENGVGVANAGTLAAQAGDLTLTASGQLVQSGTMNASGNVGINAASVANSGTVYAQQNTAINTGGAVTNSGTLAAQQNTSVNAGSVSSTGTLGAGVNGDGSVGNSGDLSVAASGQLDATGLNVAGGHATLAGSGVNLAGSETAANGNLSLAASAGDLNLTGATTSAGGAVNAQAAGALVNDRGTLTGGSGVTLNAGSLSNQGGGISSHGALAAQASGQIANQGGSLVSQGAMLVNGSAIANNQGTMQSAAGLSVIGASLDNTAGRITSLSGDGLLVTTTGALTNAAGTTATGAQGGVIGGNGAVTLQGGTVANHGTVSAQTDLQVDTQSLNNDAGALQAAGNATVNAGAQLTSSGGTIVAGQAASVTAATLDNSSGTTQAAQLSLNATNVVNHAGTITQTGTGAMNVAVSGLLDNSAGGTLQTNSTDLTLGAATLNNDGGTILAAGTGTLTIAPGNGAGTFSNAGGQIIAAGQLVAQAGSLDNSGGVLAAQGNLAASIAGDVNNAQGVVRSLSSISLASGGALTDTNGQIQSGTGAAGDASTLAVLAASIDNTGGIVGNLGTGDTTVQGGSQIVNSNGLITGNGNVAVNASSISNTQGGAVSGANVSVQAGTLDNTGGNIGNLAGSGGDVAIATTGALTNTNGQIGATRDLAVNAATLTGGGTYGAANDVAIAMQGDFAPAPDVQFNAGHDLTFTLPGTFTNAALLEAANNLGIDAGDIANSGTMMAGGTLTTHSNTLENTGAVVGGSVSLNATRVISNLGPTALIGATDSNGTLELLAPDIENRDDTTATDAQAGTAIFGLGEVVLAGGRDANGNYTNANLIKNQSGLIQSSGDMALYANQVTNTRRVMTTTGANSEAVDPALLEQLGISLSGCTATYMQACEPGHPQVLGSTGDPSMIGGVPTDPPHGGQWNSTYQYTTYTGVALANLVSAISPAAQIISGGDLDASSVGLFWNYWSQVAAVGNIAMPATLDQDSWQGQAAPRMQVTYSGQYHYDNYDNSEHNWQLPFGDAGFVTSHPGGYTQAAPADIRYYALPAYESTFVAGGTLAGTGVSIENTAGNAGIPSLGLAPGQSVTGVNVDSPGGSATQVDPVIARATAVNVLANLTIPQGGLFRPATTPGATYLIESNPAFTNAKSFLSSDYYLQQLGLNPQSVEKRLGDGLYEQQLVQNQMTSLTGKAVPGPYTDTQAMYEALLASGAALAQQLDLPLGMSLSAEQVAALTSNVVILQTQIVDGQSVLVPVVYLAQASQQNLNGPLIAATDIDLQNAQTFSNSGTVQASNTLTVNGQSIDNAFGTLQSGGLMALATTGNVDLTSATVNAGSLALNAGGNLLLNTATNTVDQVSATGATRTSTTLGPIANLNVAGDALIVTGGNFEQNAGNLNVGGNLGMAVGGNWDIGTVQTGEHKVVERANGVSDTNLNSATGSSVSVGGVSEIGVGGNLTATGANLNLAGGGTLAAVGDVTLQAATTTSTIDSNSSGSDHHGSYAESSHTSVQTLTGTTLTSGDTLNVVSGHNINVTGSAIELSQGNANLAAAGDVNIGAATATQVSNSQETHSHSNVVSGTQVASSRDTTTTLSQGSLISADGVTIASGHDINVAGSAIVGTNDVSLSAAHDVTITTSQDTMQSAGTYQEKHSGLATSGLSVTVGSSKVAQTDQESGVTNNASMIGSLDGNLNITAGNDLHVTGSVLHAGQDVTMAGKTVTIDAAYDTASQSQQQQYHSAGLTVGITNPVVSAIQTATQMTSAAQNVNGDPRLLALAGETTALAAKNAYDAVGGDPVKAATTVGINVSLGASSQHSSSTSQSSTAAGSTVSAGRNVTVAASGAGVDSNINVVGSTISAGNDALLAAQGNVNLLAAQNTASQQSDSSGGSVGVGVSLSVGSKTGLAFTAAASGNRGNADGDSSTWTNTHVTAGNALAIQSGGDTNLIGAVASGNQVIADVGGNLNIHSLQDTDTYHSKNEGAGVSVSVCAPLCAGNSSGSVSASLAKIKSNYASVNEQSGIHAGEGGFQVGVQGNTDLQGGVITSTDAAVQDGSNHFSTGSLTMSDIQNHADYEGTGMSVNIGPVVSLDGGLSPGASSAGFAQRDGSADSVTRSGISGIAGNEAARTGDQESGIKPIFDAAKVQSEIDAQVKITQQFSEQASTALSNYVTGQRADLQQKLKDATAPDEKAQIQSQLDQLNTDQRMLNVLIGVVSGQVTAAAAQGVLSEAADLMRQASIQNSSLFPGVVDSTGETLTNLSGESAGVNGDGVKLGGTRLSLDSVCGRDNSACVHDADNNLVLNGLGQPQLLPGYTVEDYLASSEAQSVAGLTGGIQGTTGTLAGIQYPPGGLVDQIIEAYAGTHDFIGGQVAGLYDDQGNTKRSMSSAEKTAHNIWSDAAILPATPFAAATALPPQVWNAIAAILQVLK
ncbi:hemagglutinin repeat-containing protein [Paraburkholderia sp. EG286B]|uniref:hemagglutinin repeat-containing protein n=1 Tax=Paraburkholderia sp. EG286B TaxID=3237011 RepID=UPI0034D28FD8